MKRPALAWCREHGLYPLDLDAWKQDAISGLGEPRDAETAETKQDRRRIKQLERDLNREIEQAQMGGARLADACAVAGLDARTVQRWRAGDGLTRGDRRPGAVPAGIGEVAGTR
jgi:hypothetical protein